METLGIQNAKFHKHKYLHLFLIIEEQLDRQQNTPRKSSRPAFKKIIHDLTSDGKFEIGRDTEYNKIGTRFIFFYDKFVSIS